MSIVSPDQPENWKAEIIRTTPDLAGRIVANSKYQRRLSTATVERYARDMTNGQWEFTGEPIIVHGHFGENGEIENWELLNGGHRLHAIIKSGVTLDLLFVFGVPPKAIKKMDGIRIRSLAQRFELEGLVGYRPLADAVKFLTNYEDMLCFSGGSYTPAEYFDTLERNPEIKTIAPLYERKMPAPWLKAGLLCCLEYLFSRKDIGAARQYCLDIIVPENLASDDPAFVCNDFIRRMEEKKRKSPRMAHAIIECWNKRRRGETMTRLRVPSDCPDIE